MGFPGSSSATSFYPVINKILSASLDLQKKKLDQKQPLNHKNNSTKMIG